MKLDDLIRGASLKSEWLDSQEAIELLGVAAQRTALYLAMHPRPPQDRRPLLLTLLENERAYRLAYPAGEEFENLFWCALLLSGLGHVEDSLPLWRAKQTNFDTGVGFDVQFLVGAGVQPTLAWLDTRDESEAAACADRIHACHAAGDFDSLCEWREARERYFAK